MFSTGLHRKSKGKLLDKCLPPVQSPLALPCIFSMPLCVSVNSPPAHARTTHPSQPHGTSCAPSPICASHALSLHQISCTLLPCLTHTVLTPALHPLAPSSTCVALLTYPLVPCLIGHHFPHTPHTLMHPSQ